MLGYVMPSFGPITAVFGFRNSTGSGGVSPPISAACSA
jgi:hypothetical protein